MQSLFDEAAANDSFTQPLCKESTLEPPLEKPEPTYGLACLIKCLPLAFHLRHAVQINLAGPSECFTHSRSEYLESAAFWVVFASWVSETQEGRSVANGQ